MWYTSKVAACGTGVAGSTLAWVVWFGNWEISSSSKAAAGKTSLHVTTFFFIYFKSQHLTMHTGTKRRTLKCTEIDALKA
jgi:hypothetical protein